MSGNSNPDYRTLTDEQLILKFQKEDIEAFNEIVFRYKDRIINFLYRYTGSREESEDIAQDAFIRLYRSKHLYQEIAKFSTWFYTIAINLAKTNLKKRKRYSSFSISNFNREEGKDLELPSAVTSPDDETNSRAESKIIQDAINSLEDFHREIIILRDIQDLDYEEIAKILDVPLGTVKSRINRAREALKVMLKDIYKPKQI